MEEQTCPVCRVAVSGRVAKLFAKISNDTCSICIGTHDGDFCSLFCGHCFHIDCIERITSFEELNNEPTDLSLEEGEDYYNGPSTAICTIWNTLETFSLIETPETEFTGTGL